LGPGSVVGGHWRIVRAIGDRGGFGTVFEVTDETKPDRDFVMKVADGPTPQQRATNEERLREEVRIAHRVTHQNACAYLEDRLDPASGVYYAIMKYAGDSLQKLLQSGDCFELLDAVDIVSQIADALDYAHAKRGIIHQDVKPANILVQGTIGAREARIGDWGISRFGRDTRRADGSPTVIATVVGMSAGYTAPEQYRGEARSASDQYCLALVFCSLLEGRVFAEHYRPRQLEQLSAAQNMTVFRALSPEPEDRFGSCGTFAAKLRDA
jgi:serine/threonine-protein kinase